MKHVLSPQERQLAKHCYWDPEAQELWVDCRKWMPKYHVFSIPGWDQMMMQSVAIQAYPKELNILAWPDFSQVAYWKKQIPAWVLESCALFPTYQLRLLHFVGRYPQMLELLDHSPILAWRLVALNLDEADLVALLHDKRTKMVEQLGWPGKQQTVLFLRKLRLRLVTEDIVDSVEVCILDEDRLEGLQSLPRVNSMALSLAARFPNLIGSRLHQNLAKLPCRPMQCKSMVAQLEDVYRVADVLKVDQAALDAVSDARYLVDVEKIYQAWCFFEGFSIDLRLDSKPKILTEQSEWQALSRLQHHYWLTDWKKQSDEFFLCAFLWEGEPIAALIIQTDMEYKIIRARRSENRLLSSEQLSQLHLWLVG